MKSNTLAKAALLLWVFTIAAFAWVFVRGDVGAGSDGRTAIVLQAGERDFVLSEMRGLLSAVLGVLEGINQGDMKRVAQSSRAAGMAGATDENRLLIAKLPLAFKTLGMSVHRDMDEIAGAAEGGRPAPELLKMTASVLTKCIACHAAWQINAVSQVH